MTGDVVRLFYLQDSYIFMLSWESRSDRSDGMHYFAELL